MFGQGFQNQGIGGATNNKPLNLTNQFSSLTDDPEIQKGLLGNWAFQVANQNGGRSYFENFANFPNNPQTGRPGFFQGFGDKLLSAYDTHLTSPNLEADILFQDTYMGGNGNKKQNVSLMGLLA